MHKKYIIPFLSYTSYKEKRLQTIGLNRAHLHSWQSCSSSTQGNWWILKIKFFSIATLGTCGMDKTHLATLFFQCGYLTIKDFDETYNVYRLGYPNEEIRQSLRILELNSLTKLTIFSEPALVKSFSKEFPELTCAAKIN